MRHPTVQRFRVAGGVLALAGTVLAIAAVLAVGSHVAHGPAVEGGKVLPQVCLSEPSPYARLRCLVPYFEQLVEGSSPARAVAQARELEARGVIDDCHLAAHEIGEAALRVYGSEVGRAFAACPMGCAEGCFHGVMEGYMSQSGSLEAALAGVPSLCQGISDDLLLRRQCLHGVGHGILRHQAVTLTRAVALCRTLPDSFGRETCTGGVLMEHVRSYLGSDEETLSRAVPTICAEAAGFGDRVLLTTCFRAIGEGLMFYTGHNLSRSEKFCQELTGEDRTACIAGARTEASLR